MVRFTKIKRKIKENVAVLQRAFFLNIRNSVARNLEIKRTE